MANPNKHPEFPTDFPGYDPIYYDSRARMMTGIYSAPQMAYAYEEFPKHPQDGLPDQNYGPPAETGERQAVGNMAPFPLEPPPAYYITSPTEMNLDNRYPLPPPHPYYLQPPNQGFNQNFTLVYDPTLPPSRLASPPYLYSPAPEDYLVASIFNFIFCCWILGLVALVKSVSTRTAVNSGNYELAVKNSLEAKKWNIAAFATGAAIWTVAVIVIIVLCAVG